MSTADPLGHTAGRHQPAPEPAARDPLCGRNVDLATTLHCGDHAGLSYHFCSARCQDRLIAVPARYISPEQVDHEPEVTPIGSGETLWTCPMHPQIIRTEPGSCPICGMALEPMTDPGRRSKNRELRDMTRRSWVDDDWHRQSAGRAGKVIEEVAVCRSRSSKMSGNPKATQHGCLENGC